MKAAIKVSGARSHWSAAAMRVKAWVEFCETCDAEKLRLVSDKLPYLSADGVMRTLSDRPGSPVVALGILRMTIDALYRAIEQNYQDDSGIAEMEAKGRAYRALPSPNAEDSAAFSADVCLWGGGARVLGNLKRHHPHGLLGERVHQWLASVPALGPLDAVAHGLAIKGLRVSFASKHLRHFDPERFAVLDEVLSLGLGYAMNPAGYQLFIDQLSRLRGELVAMGEPRRSLAQIEAGIFLLARQKVRSDSEAVQEAGE